MLKLCVQLWRTLQFLYQGSIVSHIPSGRVARHSMSCHSNSFRCLLLWCNDRGIVQQACQLQQWHSRGWSHLQLNWAFSEQMLDSLDSRCLLGIAYWSDRLKSARSHPCRSSHVVDVDLRGVSGRIEGKVIELDEWRCWLDFQEDHQMERALHWLVIAQRHVQSKDGYTNHVTHLVVLVDSWPGW